MSDQPMSEDFQTPEAPKRAKGKRGPKGYKYPFRDMALGDKLYIARPRASIAPLLSVLHKQPEGWRFTCKVVSDVACLVERVS
jgi:hypothetical protein